jgi:hypothetical protein
MQRILVMLLAVLVGGVGLLLAMGRTESGDVKLCRSNAQRFSQETAGYEAGLDALYGNTTLGQRTISELADRDKQLTKCMQMDPNQREQYKTILRRNRSIEGLRYFKFLLDTDQMQNYEAYERTQQATAAAKNKPNGL